MRGPSRDLTSLESLGVISALFTIFVLPLISFSFIKKFNDINDNIKSFCIACHISWLPANIIFLLTLLHSPQSHEGVKQADMNIFDIFMCFIYTQCIQIMFLVGLYYVIEYFLDNFDFWQEPYGKVRR